VVDVSGPVAAIESAFNVTMLVYQHPTEPRTFYAPNVEPSVDVPVPICEVAGLNNYSAPHRKSVSQPGPRGGTGSGNGGLFLSADLRQAYVPGVALTGAGQVVGLYENAQGFCPSCDAHEITNYVMANGLSSVPIITDVCCGSPCSTNPYAYADSQGELLGDIEMVIAMAPGVSEIIVYWDSDSTITASILDEMQYPTHGEPLPKQISNS
jgi:hypothetical protein